MILGEELISELGQRGELGGYFDYRAYQSLHGVRTGVPITVIEESSDRGPFTRARTEETYTGAAGEDHPGSRC